MPYSSESKGKETHSKETERDNAGQVFQRASQGDGGVSQPDEGGDFSAGSNNDRLFAFIREAHLEEAQEFRLKGYNSQVPEVDEGLLTQLRDGLAAAKSRLCLQVSVRGPLGSLWLLEQIGKIESLTDKLSDDVIKGWVKHELSRKSGGEAAETELGSRGAAQSLARRLESTLQTLIRAVHTLRAIDDYSTLEKRHDMLVAELAGEFTSGDKSTVIQAVERMTAEMSGHDAWASLMQARAAAWEAGKSTSVDAMIAASQHEAAKANKKARELQGDSQAFFSHVAAYLQSLSSDLKMASIHAGQRVPSPAMSQVNNDEAVASLSRSNTLMQSIKTDFDKKKLQAQTAVAGMKVYAYRLLWLPQHGHLFGTPTKTSEHVVADSIIRSILWQWQQPAIKIQYASAALLSKVDELKKIEGILAAYSAADGRKREQEHRNTPVSPSGEEDLVAQVREWVSDSLEQEKPENQRAVKVATLERLLDGDIDHAQSILARLGSTTESIRKVLEKKANDMLEPRLPVNIASSVRDKINHLVDKFMPDMVGKLATAAQALNDATLAAGNTARNFSDAKIQAGKAQSRATTVKELLSAESARLTKRPLDEHSRGSRLAKHWASLTKEQNVGNYPPPDAQQVLASLKEEGLLAGTLSTGDPAGYLFATRLAGELENAGHDELRLPMSPEQYATLEKGLVEYIVKWGQRRISLGVSSIVIELSFEQVLNAVSFNASSLLRIPYKVLKASIKIPYMVNKVNNYTMPGHDKPYKAIYGLLGKKLKQLGFNLLTAPVPGVIKLASGAGVTAGAALHNLHVGNKENTFSAVYQHVAEGKQSEEIKIDSVTRMIIDSGLGAVYMSVLKGTQVLLQSVKSENNVIFNTTPINTESFKNTNIESKGEVAHIPGNTNQSDSEEAEKAKRGRRAVSNEENMDNNITVRRAQAKNKFNKLITSENKEDSMITLFDTAYLGNSDVEIVAREEIDKILRNYGVKNVTSHSVAKIKIKKDGKEVEKEVSFLDLARGEYTKEDIEILSVDGKPLSDTLKPLFERKIPDKYFPIATKLRAFPITSILKEYLDERYKSLHDVEPTVFREGLIEIKAMVTLKELYEKHKLPELKNALEGRARIGTLYFYPENEVWQDIPNVIVIHGRVGDEIYVNLDSREMFVHSRTSMGSPKHNQDLDCFLRRNLSLKNQARVGNDHFSTKNPNEVHHSNRKVVERKNRPSWKGLGQYDWNKLAVPPSSLRVTWHDSITEASGELARSQATVIKDDVTELITSEGELWVEEFTEPAKEFIDNIQNNVMIYAGNKPEVKKINAILDGIKIALSFSEYFLEDDKEKKVEAIRGTIVTTGVAVISAVEPVSGVSRKAFSKLRKHAMSKFKKHPITRNKKIVDTRRGLENTIDNSSTNAVANKMDSEGKEFFNGSESEGNTPTNAKTSSVPENKKIDPQQHKQYIMELEKLKRTGKRVTVPNEIIIYMEKNSIKVKGLSIYQYIQWRGTFIPREGAKHLELQSITLNDENFNDIIKAFNEFHPVTESEFSEVNSHTDREDNNKSEGAWDRDSPEFKKHKESVEREKKSEAERIKKENKILADTGVSINFSDTQDNYLMIVIKLASSPSIDDELFWRQYERLMLYISADQSGGESLLKAERRMITALFHKLRKGASAENIAKLNNFEKRCNEGTQRFVHDNREELRGLIKAASVRNDDQRAISEKNTINRPITLERRSTHVNSVPPSAHTRNSTDNRDFVSQTNGSYLSRPDEDHRKYDLNLNTYFIELKNSENNKKEINAKRYFYKIFNELNKRKTPNSTLYYDGLSAMSKNQCYQWMLDNELRIKREL
jgi:hypothetical protein